MLSMKILLPEQTNFKDIGQFENVGFVIMSTRENIRLIARTPCVAAQYRYSFIRSHGEKNKNITGKTSNR